MRFKTILNEDQKSNLIKEINDRLQDLNISMLREILNSLKTKEEKKFSGNIVVSSITGLSLGDVRYYFNNFSDLEAKLTRIDPNNRKKVEKFLNDYCQYGNIVKFVRSENVYDVYHCIGKHPEHPLVIYLYIE